MAINSLSTGFRPGVCTSSTRPTAPYEGQQIYETDTDKMLVWNGTAWVIPNSSAQNPTGLELITTCTVTSVGGTAATASGGVVTIGSANTSITVDNAFSSLYNSYKIIASGSVGSAQDTMGLTLGASATGYYYAIPASLYGSGAITATGLFASNTGAFYRAGTINTNGINFNVELVNPFLATHTYITGSYVSNDRAGQLNGYHAVATSYSSFTINPSSASMTGGSIRVYGYRNS